MTSLPWPHKVAMLYFWRFRKVLVGENKFHNIFGQGHACCIPLISLLKRQEGPWGLEGSVLQAPIP